MSDGPPPLEQFDARRRLSSMLFGDSTSRWEPRTVPEPGPCASRKKRESGASRALLYQRGPFTVARLSSSSSLTAHAHGDWHNRRTRLLSTRRRRRPRRHHELGGLLVRSSTPSSPQPRQHLIGRMRRRQRLSAACLALLAPRAGPAHG